MDITKKIQELGLPLAYANHYAATINLIDIEEAKNIRAHLEYYGVSINKASELKWYLLDETRLYSLLIKLQYCKENNIPLVDEHGNNMEYVFDNMVWLKSFPDADLSKVTPDAFRDKKVLNEDVLSTLNINEYVGLTEETYDRYRDLENKLTLVMQALNGVGEISPEVSNNLIKLISANGTYSDNEILFAVLVYNQNRSAEEIEVIKSTIDTVMESLSQGGSLNL